MSSTSLTDAFDEIAVQIDVGAFFEREWGSGIWLFIYLTSGIGSSIFSVCMMPNNVSVGSSGAVMGLFGGKLGEIFCRACESKKSTQGRIGHEVRREQEEEETMIY
jgi:rhomboid protease GluP